MKLSFLPKHNQTVIDRTSWPSNVNCESVKNPIWNMDDVVVEARLAPHVQCFFFSKWLSNIASRERLRQQQDLCHNARKTDSANWHQWRWWRTETFWASGKSHHRVMKTSNCVPHHSSEAYDRAKHSVNMLIFRVWLGSEVPLLLIKENYLYNSTLFIGFWIFVFYSIFSIL